MKNLIKGVLMMGLFAFFACEGPPGPPGFDGRDGLDGTDIVGEVLEIGGVDFTSANSFSSDFYTINPPIEIGDKILVFLLWAEIDGEDLWRALPQTNYEFSEGIFTYNYEFTRSLVRFFVDGTFNLGLLTNEFTRNQVFRVVIFPAELVNENARVDLTNYNAVMELMGKTETDVVKLNPRD